MQSIQLGDLQLAIMRVLWDKGAATVADVHLALLEERGLAPTTIATMLQKMERKGVVAHQSEGRRFIYRPAIRERDVHRSMVKDLVERVFQGDASALVHHLLSEREIDGDELEKLKALVSAKAKEARKRHGR
ncbi:MAG: BlaI/MecI/CopY family transcriptional regulator [Planctomycetota bacterium]